jgi:DNA-binding MarR family transcriptional regulator
MAAKSTGSRASRRRDEAVEALPGGNLPSFEILGGTGALRTTPCTGIYPHVQTPCYCASLRAASRKTTALYDAALAPAGVGVAQYSLMRRIRHAGTLSVTELAVLAELDRSTVGRNVRVLERMGLVTGATADDQRETAVALTEAGRETLRRARPLWEDAQRRIEAAIGAERAETLRVLAQSL